jgi:quercetin dioxygenase-like cupin family protein
MRKPIVLALAIIAFSALALAQDAVKVDPKHYKVETENAQVRVLRVHYGAHEKSVMHSHPATVAVFLTDGTGKFTFADGKTQDFTTKPGQVQYSDATTHLPENTGDKPFEVIVIELKGHGAAAPGKSAAAPKKSAAPAKK